MIKLLKTRYSWILPLSFCLLFFHARWGLPSTARLDLIGGRAYLESQLPQILSAKTKAKAIGTQNLSRHERILFGTREFLVSPWAGDDNFTLNAIGKLNPYKFKFDPHYYMYGGGFIYAGAVFLQLSAWLGLVTLNPDATFYMRHPDELGAIFGILRFMTVLFATVGICLAHHIAHKHFGKAAGYLTLILLLAMPLTHQTARAIEPHIYVLPYFMMAMLFLLGSVKPDPLKNYLWSAIFTGAVIGIQSTSFYLIFPFFTSLYLNHKKGYLSTSQSIKYVAIFAAISSGVLLITNPFYLLNFEGFLNDFGRGTSNQVLNTYKNWAPFQLGWFLLVLYLTAVVYHLFRPHKSDVHLIALGCVLPALPNYILVCNYHMPYIFSSLAILAMLSSDMLITVFKSISRSYYQWGLVIALSTLFFINTIGRSAYYVRNYTSQNRESAGAWINTHVPAGSTIAVRFPPSVWDCVPFKFHKYHLKNLQDLATLESMPDYLVLSNATETQLMRSHYHLIQIYQPKTFFGYRFEVDGELHGLIAKTIRIYAHKDLPLQPL